MRLKFNHGDAPDLKILFLLRVAAIIFNSCFLFSIIINSQAV
jgi:hypothetical protein